MKQRLVLTSLLALSLFSAPLAAQEVAPAIPDLNLPEEQAPVAAVNTQAPAPKAAAKPVAPVQKKAAPSAKAAPAQKATAAQKTVIPVTNAAAKVNTEEVVVENLMPQQPAVAAQAPAVQPASSGNVANAAAQAKPGFASLPFGFNKNNSEQAAAPVQEQQATEVIAYNPPTDRDPTLSPDDTLLLKHREEERLRALEAERQRKLAEERRRLAELERQRQLELERLRDPSREIRGKIRVSGIIGQEVFIGNRIYSVGKSIYGARIVKVLPDSVVFTYKGQQFTKKVDLK